MNNDLKNRGNKGVALKAGLWYVISSVMVKTIAIISTPIFTRIMTTDEYGTFATFVSWYTLLLPFCTINLTYSIGRAKIDYPDELDNYIGSMQLLSALVTAVFSIVCLFFLSPLSRFLELDVVCVAFLLVYLLFSPAISFAQNGYRYRYQYKQNIAIAWYTALSTVVLALVLMLSFRGNKAILRVIGIVIPNCLLALHFWVKVIVKKQIHVNIEHWRYGFSLSAPLVLHTVCLNILSQSDRVFIQKICGTTETAIYSLAYSYGTMISILTNAIADAWLPWFHDNYSDKKFAEIRKNVKWVVILGCYIGLACIAFAPEAVLILGGGAYVKGANCVPPIALGVICQYVYTHYVNIEMHLKKTKYVSIGTIFAALLNLILNVVFIPRYGFIVAAYATFVSYMALMIIHFIITRKILKVKLYDDKFMFASVGVTTIISMMLMKTYENSLLRYAMVVIGFLSFLVVFHNYIVNFVRNKMRKKNNVTGNLE